jgi:glycosyltransferase involved in cell wall biosynthesis
MNISVAMCTYNGSRFLAGQLESIGRQTMRPFELIVCDDGSTDSTAEIVRAFGEEAPFPVRFIHNEAKLGSTKNFEKAILSCRGDAIALCDQDDVWQKGKLKRVAEVLESEPDVGGVFSDALLIDENSQPISGTLWERRHVTPRVRADLNGKSGELLLLKRTAVTGATFVFRSHFVQLITPIPSEWFHDAWMALLIATQARLCPLPEPLIRYRLHPAQQVGLRPRRWLSGLHAQREKSMEPHKLLVKRWSSMTAKLSTLPVDPVVTRLARERLTFLQTRLALRERSVVDRVIGATLALPEYFKFSNGLLSYGRDVTGS